MNEFTIGILNAIDNGKDFIKDDIISFLSGREVVDACYFTDEVLDDVMEAMFKDYLPTSLDPVGDTIKYFDTRRKETKFMQMHPKIAEKRKDDLHMMSPASEAIIFVLQTRKKV